MRNEDALRTDVRRVRHLGAARSGTSHMWAQRVTSAAMLVLTICFVVTMLSLVGADYTTARETLGRPLPALLLLAFTLTGAYHMMIGMKVIIEDYVSDTHLREWTLIGNMLFCGAVALACVYAILKIGFV